jgi:hypothetical protein
VTELRYYLVTLDGAESDTFPIWTFRGVGVEPEQVRNGPAGSTTNRWCVCQPSPGLATGQEARDKRVVLAEARRLAKRDRVPLCVEEVESVERRRGSGLAKEAP